jgi:DNA-binding transcriptional regulator YhcF (GntR family)
MLQHFVVNRRIKMPAYVQLREQIRYLILTGELTAATQLPPANRLADNLQINRHTVLRAYSELQKQGYVEFRNGVGTFVTDASKRTTDEAHLPAAFEQLDSAVRAALAGGLTPEQIAAHVVSRANALAVGGNIAQEISVRAALFECNTERLDYYRTELERELTIQITPLLISELADKAEPAGLGGVDFVITPFFHLVEVQRKLRARPDTNHLDIFAVSVRPHLDVLRNLAKLPVGTVLGILYFAGPHYTFDRLQAMVEHIEHAHLQNIARIEPIYVQGELRPEMLEGVDAVLVRPENLEAAKIELTLTLPVIEYRNVLDRASVMVLQDVIRELCEQPPR